MKADFLSVSSLFPRRFHSKVDVDLTPLLFRVYPLLVMAAAPQIVTSSSWMQWLASDSRVGVASSEWQRLAVMCFVGGATMKVCDMIDDDCLWRGYLSSTFRRNVVNSFGFLLVVVSCVVLVLAENPLPGAVIVAMFTFAAVVRGKITSVAMRIAAVASVPLFALVGYRCFVLQDRAFFSVGIATIASSIFWLLYLRKIVGKRTLVARCITDFGIFRTLPAAVAASVYLKPSDVTYGTLVLIADVCGYNLVRWAVTNWSYVKRFYFERGADLSMYLWEYCYLGWAIRGQTLAFGAGLAGFNLSWEILTAVYAVFENYDRLPSESSFSSRWLCLVLGFLADAIMLSGIYLNGHADFVFETFFWSVVCTALTMLACASSSDPHRSFTFFKYLAYPSVIAENLCLYLAWYRGAESFMNIVIILIATLGAAGRRVQKPNTSPSWIYYSWFVFLTHGVLLAFCVTRFVVYGS